MSEIYDNWERLVERVLRQVKDRELCFQLSMSSKSNSSSSDSISSSPLHPHHHASASPAIPTPNLGMKKIVFRVNLGDLQTMKGYFRGTDLLRLIGLCFAPRVSVRVDRVLLKVCSSIHGIDSIALDRTDEKLTVIGDLFVDPVALIAKLRKFCHIEIVSVGLAKESDNRVTSMPSTALPLLPHAS